MRSERWSDAGLLSHCEGFSFTPSEIESFGRVLSSEVIGSDLFLMDH